jgi:hypothetical protein
VIEAVLSRQIEELEPKLVQHGHKPRHKNPHKNASPNRPAHSVRKPFVLKKHVVRPDFNDAEIGEHLEDALQGSLMFAEQYRISSSASSFQG